MPNPRTQPKLTVSEIETTTPLFTMLADGTIRQIDYSVLKSKLEQDGLGGSAGYSFYNAGEGFWIFGDSGIVVARSSNGEFEIDVPEGKKLCSLFVLYTGAASQINDSNGMNITWTFNQQSATFNISAATAFKPVVFFEADGEQYESQATNKPSSVSVTVSHSDPSTGSFTTTFANLSTQTPPLGIKAIF